MPESELAALLRRRVQREGPLPFVHFMDTALYHPGAGYYERALIGRGGDFYTSASTGRLFGELLAFQFAQWLSSVPDGPLELVEAGAHDGWLAAVVLDWVRLRRPDLWGRLHCSVLEPSPNRRTLQRQNLEQFAGRVRWLNEPADLGSRSLQGLIFSNELLDSFPRHRLGWDAGSGHWFEWGVGWRQNRFVWERLGAIPSGLRGELDLAGFTLSDPLLDVLPDGFTVEVCPAARRWWTAAAAAIGRGWLMTVDYGLTAVEFLHPHRSNGTLRAYHRHRLATDLLAQPGEQDLTAHLNFTAIQRAGESAGLQTIGLLTQARFLTDVAEQAWIPDSGFGNWTPSCSRQFQTLTHPDHLGRAFKVFVQSTPSVCFPRFTAS